MRQEYYYFVAKSLPNMVLGMSTGHCVQAVYISRSCYWVLTNEKKEQVH